MKTTTLDVLCKGKKIGELVVSKENKLVKHTHSLSQDVVILVLHAYTKVEDCFGRFKRAIRHKDQNEYQWRMADLK